MIQRLWLKLRFWWVGPEEGLTADYETLVRLARRCAYDFSHASDFIPTKKRPKIYWDPGIEWDKRAEMWIALFAKGNPGKDYRLKYLMELEEAERDRDALIEFIKAKGLLDDKDMPQDVINRYGGDIPF